MRDQLHELVAAVQISQVNAAEGHGGRGRSDFADAPSDGAEMMGLDEHGRALGVDDLHQIAGDLLRDPFLVGEPARVHSDEPDELRDADQAVGRDVANVGLADDRHHMVFTAAHQVDRALDDMGEVVGRTARALVREDGPDLLVTIVPGRHVDHGPEPALWGCLRSRSMCQTEPEENLAGVVFVLLDLVGCQRFAHATGIGFRLGCVIHVILRVKVESNIRDFRTCGQ